jgi:hypothetical protein
MTAVIDDPKLSWRKTHLSLLVIYENPKDYPGKVVGRWHHIAPGGTWIERDPAFVVDTLAEARARYRPGSTISADSPRMMR